MRKDEEKRERRVERNKNSGEEGKRTGTRKKSH